jgi:hypothetical protein
MTVTRIIRKLSKIYFTFLEVHTNCSLNLNTHSVALYPGLLQYLQQAEGENYNKDPMKSQKKKKKKHRYKLPVGILEVAIVGN